MRAALAACCLWWCACARVHAQTATIELRMPSCLDASFREALRHHARLELRSDGAELVDESPRRVTLELPCGSSPQHATLSLDGEAQPRSVELADVPKPLRARTLALAVAELWRASTTAAQIVPEPAVVGTRVAVPSVQRAEVQADQPPSSLAPGHKAVERSQPSAAVGVAVSPSPQSLRVDRQRVASVVADPAVSPQSKSSLVEPQRAAVAGTQPSAAADAAASPQPESSQLEPQRTLSKGLQPAAAVLASPASQSSRVEPQRAASTRTQSSAAAGGAARPGSLSTSVEPWRAKSAGPQLSAAAGGAENEPSGVETVRSAAIEGGATVAPRTVGAASPLMAASGDGRVDAGDAEISRVAASPRSGPGVFAAPAARLYLASRDVVPGVQVGFVWQRLRVGAEGFYGERSDALGTARFGVVQGFVSWELLRVELGAFGLALAPRAAVGGVLAAAEAASRNSGDAVSTLAWDAAGEAAFWRTLGERWSLALRLHAGYASGVRLASDAGELAQLHGPFAAASLALALQLGDAR